MEKKNLMLKKKENGSFQKRKPGREKIKSKPFFQPGRRRFNIFITLIGCCGGYPRARGWGGVFLVSLLIRVPQGDDCGGYPRATERGHFSFESFGVEVFFLSAFRNFSYLCHGLGMRSVH